MIFILLVLDVHHVFVVKVSLAHVDHLLLLVVELFHVLLLLLLDVVVVQVWVFLLVVVQVLVVFVVIVEGLVVRFLVGQFLQFSDLVFVEIHLLSMEKDFRVDLQLFVIVVFQLVILQVGINLVVDFDVFIIVNHVLHPIFILRFLFLLLVVRVLLVLWVKLVLLFLILEELLIQVILFLIDALVDLLAVVVQVFLVVNFVIDVQPIVGFLLLGGAFALVDHGLGRGSAFREVFFGGFALSVVFSLFEAVYVIHVDGDIHVIVDFVEVKAQVVVLMVGCLAVSLGDVLSLFVGRG